MADCIDLGPLLLSREPQRWCFSLNVGSDSLTLEVPADFDQHLAEKLRAYQPDDAAAQIEIDLKNLPAISSRQLGLMLAVHKVFRSRAPRLRVRGVTPGVRRLLEVTRTDQFFEIA